MDRSTVSGTRSGGEETATAGSPAAGADVQLDYVGSVADAAKVIGALHAGEKRLVEELGARLRELGVTPYLVHASLSLEERRRAERAFAEGHDCVVVSTSVTWTMRLPS